MRYLQILPLFLLFSCGPNVQVTPMGDNKYYVFNDYCAGLVEKDAGGDVTISQIDCAQYQITDREFLSGWIPGGNLAEGDDVIVVPVDQQADFLKFLGDRGTVK